MACGVFGGGKSKEWTQEETAERLGVTQAYLSMMERGLRVMPARLARKAAGMLHAPATTLPSREESLTVATATVAGSERVRRELAALGYPRFALSKLERNIQRDRDDVKHLARTIPLDDPGIAD